MVSTKVIAIIAVAVVVVAGAGVAAVTLLNNKDDSTERVDTALPVYGNANNDTKVDSADVDLIQEIIDGKKEFKDYPMADANNDKDVTSADIEKVNAIIGKTTDKVFIQSLTPEGNATATEIAYPLTNIVVIGTNMVPVTINAGAIPALAGWYQGSTPYPNAETAMKDVYSLGKAGRSALSDTLWKNFTDRDAKLKADTGTGIQAFFVDHSLGSAITTKIRSDLAASGIPEVRLAVADPYQDISSTMMLGFLVGGKCEETARNYAEKSFDVLTDIKSKVSGLADADKKTYIGITMLNYVCENESTFGQIGSYVGGVPYYTVNDDFKATYDGNGSTVMNSTEALSNYAIAAKLGEKRGIDVIFSNRTVDFKVGEEGKNAQIVAQFEGACSQGAKGVAWDYFKDLDCYKGVWYINNLLPGACKLAYAAACMYPDQYSMDDANNVAKDFATFCPSMDGVTIENSNLCWGYDAYVAAKAA